jgi:hypothetical protein
VHLRDSWTTGANNKQYNVLEPEVAIVSLVFPIEIEIPIATILK